MKEINFKNFCMTHRYKVNEQLKICMNELIGNPIFKEVMYKENEKVCDIDVIRSLEYIFIETLHRHLKPKKMRQDNSLVNEARKILKCRKKENIKKNIIKKSRW